MYYYERDHPLRTTNRQGISSGTRTRMYSYKYDDEEVRRGVVRACLFLFSSSSLRRRLSLCSFLSLLLFSFFHHSSSFTQKLKQINLSSNNVPRAIFVAIVEYFDYSLLSSFQQRATHKRQQTYY